MQKILFPQQFQDNGPEVKNLQDAIIALSGKINLYAFRALFRQSDFRHTFHIEQAERRYGEATRQVVYAYQELTMKIAPTGMIDEATAVSINDLLVKHHVLPAGPEWMKVYGTVYDEWIRPLPGARVKVFDKEMRGEYLLGETTTNDHGRYHIDYNHEKLPGADKGAPDIVVRLYGGDGNLIRSSQVYYNVTAELRADLNLGPRAYLGPAQFEQALDTIRPLTGQVPISELTENDVTFLLSKTNASPVILVQLIQAFSFEKWTGLSAEVFYGILSQGRSNSTASAYNAGIPSDVPGAIEQSYIDFWSTPVATMITEFQQAADQNIISYTLCERKQEIQAQLQRLSLAPPQVPGGKLTQPVIYTQLTLAGLNPAQQQAVLANYNPTSLTPALWKTLAADPAFTGDAGAAAINKLQVVVQLSAWTGGNTGLVSYLMNQEKLQAPGDLASMAGNTIADWENIINASGQAPADTAGGNTGNTTVTAIAGSLASGIETQYPSQVLAARFTRSTTLTIANKPVLSNILNAGDFNITETSVPAYIRTYIQKNPLPAGASQQTVTHQLLGIQRVYKLSGNADHSLSLLGGGIQSARQIYQMGRQNFVGQYTAAVGSDTAAATLYDKAELMHAASSALAGQVAARLNNPSTHVFMNYNNEASHLLNDYPDLANLFGMGSTYCDCSDCTSFLSIPAYLTDLLDFLYQRKALTKPNARALLLANDYSVPNGKQQWTWRRRPDIADIDLNCDNTNVELPYIDIVNELLEDYIIPPIALIRVPLGTNNIAQLYEEFLIWLFVYLAPGQISAGLYNLLMQIAALPDTPICNISLLSTAATVSTVFFTDGENYPDWMMDGQPLIAEWIVRDEYITLKLSLIYLSQSADQMDQAFGANIIDSDIFKGQQVDSSNLQQLSTLLPQDYVQEKIMVSAREQGNAWFGIVVQEIHQTHLSMAEISANPEYTNTNVYNALGFPFATGPWTLYPTAIPMSLPFDLYFTQANSFLQKMGVQRYSLINAFGQQNPGTLQSAAIAYLGLSIGQADIIFTARVYSGAGTDPQIRFWGSQIGGQVQAEVDLFLSAGGLSFVQLQTLLKLQFINPAGDSVIAENLPANATVYDACNTALMLLTNLTSQKLDHINRFLRLWNALNPVTGISMEELDNCISWLGLGNLDYNLATGLYYFLQLMQQLSLTATQLLSFYHDIDTNPDNNLYQQLFQNRQLTNPLVTAFNWPLPGNTLITDAQANPGAVAVILAVCGITQADLTSIMTLKDGATYPYVLLTLTNLSFIYSCGLLARALGISVTDLITFSGLVGINPVHQLQALPVPVASPQTTYTFVQKFNEIKTAGFTVDAINYLLTNQSNATPSLVPDPSGVVNDLEGIRSALQAAIAATTVAPDPQGTLLTKWLADTDLGWDKDIAARLLSILAQTNDNTYLDQVLGNLRLLQLLRTQYGQSSAITYLEMLPSIALPDATIGSIVYDNTNYYLFVRDALSAADSQFLSQLPGIDAAGNTAVQALYNQSQGCPISAVSIGAAVPGWITANQAAIAQNVPGFSWGQGVLGFTGVMSGPVYFALLAQGSDAQFGAALTQLLIASQGAAAAALTYVQLTALPSMSLPDAALNSLSYGPDTETPTTTGLSFTGTMNAADCLALLGLSGDANYVAAILALYIAARSGQTVFAPLAALPAGWAALPDLTGMAGFSAQPVTITGTVTGTQAPVIRYSGQMTSAVQSALANLSPQGSWGANVAALYALAKTAGSYGVTLGQPGGINVADFATYGVQYTAAGANMTLAVAGQLSPANLTSLQALNTDATYQAALLCLYNQSSALFGVSLPPIALPDAALGTAAYTTGTIQFTGAPNLTCNDGFNLTQLGADPRYQNAINFIYSNPALPAGAIGVVLPSMPQISFPAGGPISWQDGVLSYTGQMPAAELTTLLGLSDNASYQAAVNQLYTQSQVTSQASLAAVAGGALPDGIVVASLTANGVAVQGNGPAYLLSFTGPMTPAQQAALLALVPPGTNDTYTQAVQTLYQGSQAVVANTVPLAALPAATIPGPVAALGWNYNTAAGILSYTGGAPVSAANLAALTTAIQTTDPDFAIAVQQLGALTAAAGAIQVIAPPPDTPFASAGIVLSGGAAIGYQGGTLQVTGPMSFVDYQGILALSPATPYRQAVTNVYIHSQGVAAGTVTSSAAYFNLPAITIPSIYAVQFGYTAAASTLTLKGWLEPADLSVLQSLGSAAWSLGCNYPYQQALAALYQTANTANAAYGGPFDAAYSILTATTGNPPAALGIADRYGYFLHAISANYQTIKQMDALSAQIAANFSVTSAVADTLVSYVSQPGPGGPGDPDYMLYDFTDPSFTGNTKAINPDPNQFPLAQWYVKLDRMSFLINTLQLSAADVQWLLQNGASVQAFNLCAWPTAAAPLTFASWETLYNLHLFEQQYPPVMMADPANPGDTTRISVYTIVSAALAIPKDLAALPVIPPNPGMLLSQLSLLTGWNATELAYLLGVGQPNSPNLTLDPLSLTATTLPPVGCTPALSNIAVLLQLSNCFQLAGRLKAVPSRCVSWVTDPITATMAVDIKQALKSIYPDAASWLSAIQPLMNTLRQKRRDALSAYLLSNIVSNPFGTFDIFPDQYYLYGNFLIDTQMGACQPTTRTIQAYCSIQLFVQRCLLNIEYPNIAADSSQDADWLQWSWMGTFESWYEARYTFLFPENLIMPQALPGQSPFFQDLQDDLTQGPVTVSMVENAFGNYIQSLDGVARLEVKGMWYDAFGPTLHVFARTYGGDPNVYCYRSFNYNTQRWSAWQQVTADIAGNEIIPVVQNGRLFLYWPVFTQASDDDKSPQPIPSTSGTNNPAPPPTKYWTIQLAFSEYVNGQWTGKKVSTDELVSNSITYPDEKTPSPNTSDFVFIALDIPVPVPGASAFAQTSQSLSTNGNIYIACYYNAVSKGKKGGVAGDWLLLVNGVNNDSGTPKPTPQPNAFLLDPLRGYPGAVNILDTVAADSAVSPVNWFKSSIYEDMLLTGTLPLLPQQQGAAAATALLSKPANASYAVLPNLQLGLWSKYNFAQTGNAASASLGGLLPFFYQDKTRTFFVNQEITINGISLDYPGAVDAFLATAGGTSALSSFFSATGKPSTESGPQYQFLNFYHPYAHQLIRLFAQYGVERLLARDIQLTGDAKYGTSTPVLANPIINNAPGYQPFNFSTSYGPSGAVLPGTDGLLPIEQIDFGMGTSYGPYNWELFYHGVLLAGMLLSQNQQFEEANNWFKLIFNPTDTSNNPVPEKYWVTKPFFENNNSTVSIDDLILSQLDPASQPAFWQSVKQWRNDPYDPHMLAQNRITPYMYAAFMKTLDNLIAWANFNYQQYTMESVNIAIQLYMYALEILGTQPQAIPPIAETPVCNYYQFELELELIGAIDEPDGYLSDPVVIFENLLPPAGSIGTAGSSGAGGSSSAAPGTPKLQLLKGLYFCIPPNKVLLGYWDTIESELTKIRNCMNIQGQFQPLSPFPNVPGAGFPDDSGINDFGGILPNYRFKFMIQKAVELCNEVKSLGAALLAALEKTDAEQLALIRAGQEVSVQTDIDTVKKLQVTDTQLSLQNLQNYQILVQQKIDYYTGLVQTGLIPLEQQALALNQFSLALEGPIATATILASILKLIPNFDLGASGFGGTPLVTASIGGQEFGGAADCFVEMMSYMSHFADKSAAIAATNAGYSRRAAEWTFQAALANDEMAQVKSQILAAQNRITIAQTEEANQQKVVQNAQAINTFLQNKYTNRQLYSWMVTQIANVYFQSYQLAYSFAKQAEVCFGYELGITGSSYISYGYWDTLHKGLLSGEGLISSLRQMETDYYNRNIREYELTRQISLAQLDPMSLLQLKASGSCFINIPEELFDLDYPGQYFRRIKHVAITLPGIVGPYTPVCLKMTLLNNSVRIDNTAGTAKNYPRNIDSTGAPTNDSRFLDNVAATQYMATSNGVNDNGLFEMNLNDDRYLPFERAGAISSWKVEFPGTFPQFDPSTITDLIIHFSYTSRDGGAALQEVAVQSVQSSLKTAMTDSGLVLVRGFSARRDFPTQWYKFLNPTNPGDPQDLDMALAGRFPYFTQGMTINISSVVVVADVPAGAKTPVLYLSGMKLSDAPLNFGPNPALGSMLYSVTNCKDGVGEWTVTNGTAPNLTPLSASGINDLYFFFYYSIQS